MSTVSKRKPKCHWQTWIYQKVSVHDINSGAIIGSGFMYHHCHLGNVYMLYKLGTDEELPDDTYDLRPLSEAKPCICPMEKQ